MKLPAVSQVYGWRWSGIFVSIGILRSILR